MNIAKLLLQLLDLAVVGALAKERYDEIQEIVKPIVEEGRDPTPEEWAQLRSMDLDLDDRLDDANARLNG